MLESSVKARLIKNARSVTFAGDFFHEPRCFIFSTAVSSRQDTLNSGRRSMKLLSLRPSASVLFPASYNKVFSTLKLRPTFYVRRDDRRNRRKYFTSELPKLRLVCFLRFVPRKGCTKVVKYSDLC